jgi:hypothetical protein
VSAQRTVKPSSPLRSADTKKVLEVLSIKSASYNQIVEKTGLNTRYVASCLSYLVALKKVSRKPHPSTGSKGRPPVIYYLNHKPKPARKKIHPKIFDPTCDPLPEALRPKPRHVEKPIPKVDYNKIAPTCKFKKRALCRHGRYIKTKVRCTKHACPFCK